MGKGEEEGATCPAGSGRAGREAQSQGQWAACKSTGCEGCGESHLGRASNPGTEGECPEEGGREVQARQGPVRAPAVVAADEAKALRDANAHVKAVGQDEAHAAAPSGQEIG